MPGALSMQTHQREGLRVHCVEPFRRFGVDAFVTDRFGGVSSAPFDSLNLGDHVGDDATHVLENRRRVACAIGVEPDRLITIRQVHGAVVLEASHVTATSEGDGLFATTTDVALAVLVADCVPVLLVDDSSTGFAVVHAGWRGLDARILANAVARFSDPQNLHAFVGPSISRGAYQVGAEVARRFEDVEGALAADDGDRFRLDLRHVARRQLLGLGVADDNLLVSDESTDGGAVYFSDRNARPCGRFALVAKRSS